MGYLHEACSGKPLRKQSQTLEQDTVFCRGERHAHACSTYRIRPQEQSADSLNPRDSSLADCTSEGLANHYLGLLCSHPR